MLPLISDGDVHVWRARIDSAGADPEEDRALLSADELDRARRFVRAADARRFIAARAILRRLLATYLGADARALRFEYGRHGKPRLSGAVGHTLCFSVAHSAGAALFAFVRGRRIGVDLELIRDPAPLDVARQFFAADELEALLDLAPAERAPAFYRCWTRKEAYLKAKGIGLSAPLDAFAVSLAPGASYPLAWSRFDPEDIGCWSFLEPAAVRGFAASIAVERMTAAEDVRCEVRDWQPRSAGIIVTGCP
jgi:4'-phosphopantetheinyl transferase